MVVSLAAASAASAVSLGNGVPASGDPTASEPLGKLNYDGLTDPAFAARVSHYLAEHGMNHPMRLDLQGKSPIDVARTTLNSEVRDGRTVAEWIKLSKTTNLMSLRPTTLVKGDLVNDISRLDADAGAPLTSAQIDALRVDVAALPASASQPFADLVHRVADVYEAQMPVAKAVVARAQTAKIAPDLALTNAERESTLTNALSLIAAENAFRDAVKNVPFAAAVTPRVQDPNGLVIFGSSGNDVYEQTGILKDPILIVDPAGDDTYHTTAGAACPDALGVVFVCNGLVLSTVLDLTGNDSYSFVGAPQEAQGSGAVGGIGVLFDVTGDDHYTSELVRGSRGANMYLDAGTQGNGFAGVGVLLDATGNDRYEADVTSGSSDIWDMSQGFGNVGGVGILADGTGDNQFLAYGFDNQLSGFQGLYPDGTGFYGGVGVLASTGLGNSQYHAWDNATTTDFYAYGFGAFGGTGIFYDDGGNDNYAAVESSTNPFIVPLLNCAYGTASYAGLGVFLDMGGNDQYFGDTRSPRDAYTMNEGFGGPTEGEGIFLDVSGDDGHFMQAHSSGGEAYTTGRGILFSHGAGLTGNTAGIFLDLGGTDQYTGATPSQDNAAWAMGADINAGAIPAIITTGG